MSASSTLVVRLPGARLRTNPSPDANHPGAPRPLSPGFVPDGGEFPVLGSPHTRTTLGAWEDLQGQLDLQCPVERQGAVSPGFDFSLESPQFYVNTPPAQHTVAPSPSPSDVAAADLAAAVDAMEVDSNHINFQDIQSPPQLHSTPALNSAAPQFVPESTFPAPSQDAAYWRACAEHWHSVCLELKAHIADGVALCHTLPPAPTPQYPYVQQSSM